MVYDALRRGLLLRRLLHWRKICPGMPPSFLLGTCGFLWLSCKHSTTPFRGAQGPGFERYEKGAESYCNAAESVLPGGSNLRFPKEILHSFRAGFSKSEPGICSQAIRYPLRPSDGSGSFRQHRTLDEKYSPGK